MANIDQEFSDGSVRWIVRDTKSPANSSNAGLMSSTDKVKLDGYPVKGTDTTKFLRNDGQWVVPPNTAYNVASASANGLMSSTDKVKLDGYPVKGTDTTKFLRNDGQWVVPPNTAYTLTKATTSSLGGVMIGNNLSVDSSGKVGVSLSGNANQYLSGNGQWAVPTNSTYSVVSTSTNGLAPKLPTSNASAKFLRGDGSWEAPPGFTLDKKYDQVTLPKQTGYLQYEMKSQYMRPSWTGYDSHKLQLSTVPQTSIEAYIKDTLGSGNLTTGQNKIMELLGSDNWSDVRVNSKTSTRYAGMHIVKFKPINGYKWSPITLYKAGKINTSLVSDANYETNSQIALMTHWIVHKRALEFDLFPRQEVSFTKPLLIYYDTEDTNLYNNNGVIITADSQTNTNTSADVLETTESYDRETTIDLDYDGNEVTITAANSESENSKKLYLFTNSNDGSSITPETVTIGGNTATIGKHLLFAVGNNVTLNNKFFVSGTEYVNCSYKGSKSHERYFKFWCRNASREPIQVISIGQPETKGYRKSARELVIKCVKEQGVLEFTDSTVDYNNFIITNDTVVSSVSISYAYDYPLETLSSVGLSKNGITISPEGALEVTVDSASKYTSMFSDGTKEYRQYNDFIFKFKPRMSSGKFTVTFDVPANSNLYTKPQKLKITGIVDDATASSVIFNTETTDATTIAEKVSSMKGGKIEDIANIGDYIRFKFDTPVPLQSMDETNPDETVQHSIPSGVYYRAVLIGTDHFNTPELGTVSGGLGCKPVKGAFFAICKDNNGNDISFTSMAMNKFLSYKSSRGELDYKKAYYAQTTSGGDYVKQDSNLATPSTEVTNKLNNLYTFERRNNSQGGWYASHIRLWLNSVFYNALPQILRDNIATATIPASSYLLSITNNSMSEHTVVAQTTADKIWLLSAKEVTGKNYTNNPGNDSLNSQFEYFKYGNYTEKGRYNDPSDFIGIWTRSQRISTDATAGSEEAISKFFLIKSNSNTVTYNTANNRYGIVPCFVI